MNPADLIAVAVIAILAVLAILYARKHPDCSGDCLSCKTSCSKAKPGDVPRFVRLYRRDHPKSENSAK